MAFRDVLNNKSPMSESVQSSLQNLVNSLIDAGNVTQTAHWNLRSSVFVAIHPWFGETYDSLFDIADAAAEQIKQANIDLMVNVTKSSTTAATNEQELFLMVKASLENVITAMEKVYSDPETDHVLKSLVDMWEADIKKMLWFIIASTSATK